MIIEIKTPTEVLVDHIVKNEYVFSCLKHYISQKEANKLSQKLSEQKALFKKVIEMLEKAEL
jgi:hypothetical protein